MPYNVTTKLKEVKFSEGGDWVIAHDDCSIVYESYNDRVAIKRNGDTVSYLWGLEPNARRKLIRAGRSDHGPDVIVRDDY